MPLRKISSKSLANLRKHPRGSDGAIQKDVLIIWDIENARIPDGIKLQDVHKALYNAFARQQRRNLLDIKCSVSEKSFNAMIKKYGRPDIDYLLDHTSCTLASGKGKAGVTDKKLLQEVRNFISLQSKLGRAAQSVLVLITGDNDFNDDMMDAIKAGMDLEVLYPTDITSSALLQAISGLDNVWHHDWYEFLDYWLHQRDDAAADGTVSTSPSTGTRAAAAPSADAAPGPTPLPAAASPCPSPPPQDPAPAPSPMQGIRPPPPRGPSRALSTMQATLPPPPPPPRVPAPNPAAHPPVQPPMAPHTDIPPSLLLRPATFDRKGLHTTAIAAGMLTTILGRLGVKLQPGMSDNEARGLLDAILEAEVKLGLPPTQAEGGQTLVPGGPLAEWTDSELEAVRDMLANRLTLTELRAWKDALWPEKEAEDPRGLADLVSLKLWHS